MSQISTAAVEQFISRWKASGASERANYQLFLTELCELLGVEKPMPATDKVHEATYTFERPVVFDDGEGKTSTNFIDLYKKDCFVLEAKQGSDKADISEAEKLGAERVKTKTGTATRDTRTWEREMKKAKEQALRYARSLPTTEGWPPFLAVVDVGYCIDLYADFARQGKTYVPFPDPQNYRITLADFENEEVRERLRLLFTEPLELDPSRRAARVTRQLAERLAKLATSLEQTGYTPEQVSGFLMRCLFTMFAEDVELLPKDSFKELLKLYRQNIQYFPSALKALWESMDKGGFAPALHREIPQFNGYLFKDPEALPITEAQLDLLILAAEANWADVEPAIFGTLLERALQPRERHKLGAHYTPRAYVERLVMPTVIEPLREEWEAARTASAILEDSGDEAGARKEIENFHRRLCSVRVLDPACGSGNFLYVTLEHLKRLEGEVTEYLEHFPGQLKIDMTGGYTVTPAQLLGLEVNPRAAAIADVVLWIGYLQWHFRAHGSATRLSNPILREYGNIKQQDAVLSYSDRKPRLDANKQPVTRWDGHSTKPHPVTGQEVPDETARTIVYDYLDPKPATWPEADFIVGNPPFIGDKAMRGALGDGYVDALRKAYKSIVPESADFVMFWWHKAAEIVRADKAERFGFITTNSLKQTFNRRVIQEQLDASNALSIVYAIPDHPWVDSADGAAVRIAMTVGDAGKQAGRLSKVVVEKDNGDEKIISFDESIAKIHSDLSVGAEITSAVSLKSNQSISSFGMMLAGSGFIVTPDEAKALGLGTIPELEQRIRPYRNGRDLTSTPRGVMLIDMFPLSEVELRTKFPEVYQHLSIKVKPEREQNNRKRLKEQWWLFGECRQGLRAALKGLQKYISTPETAKHRFFVSQDASILPDHKLVNIALEDAYHLGVLSSKHHVLWAMAAGGRLGVGNDSVYNSTRCFQTFPFPAATEAQQEQIRSIAEALDAHRKQRQAQHPTLTITDMYNVLEKLRSGEALTPKEQKTHEQGLVSILLQLHQELDAAVAAAYGWPANLPEEEILERLVALNKERAAEEARGLIRWLRPAYQNPQGTQQGDLGMESKKKGKAAAVSAKEQLAWPKNLSEQAQAVQRALQLHERPATAQELLHQFKPVAKAQQPQRLQQINSLLQTLHGLGLLRKTEQEQYVK
ncbi:type II restriction/modification system DNA methylase subunit YeeA [Pontibacter ummariensis]|uniref:site-specific DNA-methyltransferase (adenine-specific) n=1 Tax=Pontibacter ummariensis TaxID=1610492 RepID=A0A239ITJ2_9BACT|nr:DNA methyltransferase [Pontibacter ummariensis]PRY08960.1 type II restriction/modification system DNA methylase subunit YeeA [Pontibacter ummariensis]SNS97096.1 Type II restriction/modification system, DNA methylase subunit YeeA [Pontibacter ummariensis]